MSGHRMHFRAATSLGMRKLWPFVMLAGGALVVIAFVVWFDDADCGSDRDCGYLVELALWFWILLTLGIATVIAGFILRSKRDRKQR
jgi:hypothetical protein